MHIYRSAGRWWIDYEVLKRRRYTDGEEHRSGGIRINFYRLEIFNELQGVTQLVRFYYFYSYFGLFIWGLFVSVFALWGRNIRYIFWLRKLIFAIFF